MSYAHVINEKERTQDIFGAVATDFESLLLSPYVIQGLRHAGFVQPSPIQLQAIPYAKCGVDLICQAKSGTGKTCVFTVCALEIIDVKNLTLQVLVLAPTREIAHQINEVISNIGRKIEGLNCALFIGGTPVEENIKSSRICHIATGTPGRVKCLIEKGIISTEFIRLFVLDEADKLLEEGKGSFQEQINWIYSTLQEDKQVLAVSATYPESLARHLSNYMRDPVHVRINIGDLALKGVKQYMSKTMFHPFPVKAFEEKCSRLLEIIQNVPFQQCMVFSNFQSRTENLSKMLCKEGWPCTFISGSQIQAARVRAIDQLKNYNCRILISTDLTARGIDCDKVDLVINLDLPWETETYLHRVGRAGRFGSFGIAISIVSEGEEVKKINNISNEVGKEIVYLPTDLKDIWLQAKDGSSLDIDDEENSSDKNNSDMLANENDRNVFIVKEVICSILNDIYKTENMMIPTLLKTNIHAIENVSHNELNGKYVTSDKNFIPTKKIPKYLTLSKKMNCKKKIIKEKKYFNDGNISTELMEPKKNSTCLNVDEGEVIVPSYKECADYDYKLNYCPAQVSLHDSNSLEGNGLVTLDKEKIVDTLSGYPSLKESLFCVDTHASISEKNVDTEMNHLENKLAENILCDVKKQKDNSFNFHDCDIGIKNESLSGYTETSSNLINSTDLESLTYNDTSSITDNSWEIDGSKYMLRSSEDSGWKSNEYGNYHRSRTWNDELFKACFYKAYYNHVSLIHNFWSSS